MSKKKNSKLGAILIGPALVVGGILALWENEGRFNYYEAARDAVVITSPSEHLGEPVSYTSYLDMTIPIKGEYVEQFEHYHVVKRQAQIYSWEESEDSDGNTTWKRGWYSSLENNSRNRGLHQKLSSRTLYPDQYSLGDLEISPRDIHFVDTYLALSVDTLEPSNKAQSLGLQQRVGYLYLDKGRSDSLGDERISYRGIPYAEVASYFGVVEGGKGVGRQFEENTGFISGIIGNDGILHHLVNGERSESLIKIEADFTRTVWYTRLGGTLAIIVGINVFLSAFMSLLYRIPLLGGLVEYSVFLISLILGVPVALMVMLVSMAVHNLISVVVPVILIIVVVLYFQSRSRETGRRARKVLYSRLSDRVNKVPARQKPAPAAAGLVSPAESDMQKESATEMDDFDFVIEDNRELDAELERSFLHLAAMGMAEGGLKKRENNLLVRWGERNGLKKARMKELFGKLRGGSGDRRDATREDLELMVCMALVDGELSRSEWALLSKFASKMNVSKVELRNLIVDIEKNPLQLA